MNTLSATLMLLVLMDPVGNLPIFTSVLQDVEPGRRARVCLRELVLALLFLVLVLFVGRFVFAALHLEKESVRIGGGLILAFIAFRMLFSEEGSGLVGSPGREPFLVPLAVPMVAGPSVISLLLLLSSSEPERSFDWLLALVLAWVVVAAVLSFSGWIGRLLGDPLLEALQRVMGMLLVCLAVQMILDGVAGTLAGGG